MQENNAAYAGYDKRVSSPGMPITNAVYSPEFNSESKTFLESEGKSDYIEPSSKAVDTTKQTSAASGDYDFVKTDQSNQETYTSLATEGDYYKLW